MNCTKHPDQMATGMCSYCGKPFCDECLVEVDGKMVCRDDVTRLLMDAKEAASKVIAAPQPINIYNTNTNANTSQSTAIAGANLSCIPLKSKMTTLLLCIFLGWAGGHRFYLGKPKTAILFLFTRGLFFCGWVVDIVLILMNKLTDKYGRDLG